jgi:hypothetical protein
MTQIFVQQIIPASGFLVCILDKHFDAHPIVCWGLCKHSPESNAAEVLPMYFNPDTATVVPAPDTNIREHRVVRVVKDYGEDSRDAMLKDMCKEMQEEREDYSNLVAGVSR